MSHFWTADGRDLGSEISDVSGVVNGYPHDDPFLIISVLAADAREAAKTAADHAPSLPVLGLAAIVPYLCWYSRDPALNERVRASLDEVSDVLAELPCPHADEGEHPGDSVQEPDALVHMMWELADLDGDEPDDERAELWACPGNLSSVAVGGIVTMEMLLAPDGPVAGNGEGVYAPGLQDIPDVFFDHVNDHHTILITKYERERPIYPQWLVSPLFKVVRREQPLWDRPEDDPRGLLLWIARELRARPDGPTGAGLLLALSSAYTSAMGDEVPERAVRDELVEAFSEAHRVRRDATCAHAGEHPALDPEETLVAAAKLWDPDYTDAEVESRPVTAGTAEAVACPAHVRDIALRAATDLRRDVAGRFGPSAGADLDARFRAEDGTLRADRVARDVRFHNAGPDLEASPAVWCARRVLAGAADPREHAALVMSVVHAARHPHWYADLPGAVAVLAEALTAVVAADPGECGHTDGHTLGEVASYGMPVLGQLMPPVYDSLRYELPPAHPERRPFVRPNKYRDEEGKGPDRWRCPVHLAALARLALAETSA
ncbi:hypothetical protein [Actinomadura sp. WMMB 499]|uniref:hypothetical protein n=1 Tax=Actinomadura sp. WMMB 499 TaxID=1219491 RepID=UPI001243EF7D|nr:hypothetical protein [Actinomadura sp. WMMB 499]QFG23017.1 hypothetical protein F7P10_19725 [Actinomadura sp. WMMB 499]